MRKIIVAAVVVSALLAAPVSAQESARPGKRGGGKGALIGALIGGAGAVVYGLTVDYCRNEFGDYDGPEIAKFCAAPIAGIIGGSALAGYFIGRHDVRDRRDARVRTPATEPGADLLALVPTKRFKQPPPAPSAEHRFYRTLFLAASSSP